MGQGKLDAEIGQEHTIELLQLGTGQHHVVSADSATEKSSWVQALTHRRLALQQPDGAAGLGFTLDDELVASLESGGAAELAGALNGQVPVQTAPRRRGWNYLNVAESLALPGRG